MSVKQVLKRYTVPLIQNNVNRVYDMSRFTVPLIAIKIHNVDVE